MELQSHPPDHSEHELRQQVLQWIVSFLGLVESQNSWEVLHLRPLRFTSVGIAQDNLFW